MSARGSVCNRPCEGRTEECKEHGCWRLREGALEAPLADGWQSLNKHFHAPPVPPWWLRVADAVVDDPVVLGAVCGAILGACVVWMGRL